MFHMVTSSLISVSAISGSTATPSMAGMILSSARGMACMCSSGSFLRDLQRMLHEAPTVDPTAQAPYNNLIAKSYLHNAAGFLGLPAMGASQELIVVSGEVFGRPFPKPILVRCLGSDTLPDVCCSTG